MNREDILETRCLIAFVANVPPDNIEVVHLVDIKNIILFCIPYKICEKEYELVTTFDEKPTIKDISEQINFLIDAGLEISEKDEY